METIFKSSPCSYSITNNKTDSPISSLIHTIQSCKSLNQLKQIHSYIIKTSPTIPLQLLYTKIITISATSSSNNHIPDTNYLHSVLTKLDNPTIDLYNIVLKSFIRSNHNPLLAFLFYTDLHVKGLVADTFTYPFVLKSCTLMCALREGQQLHSHVFKNGFVLNLYVVNMLIRFYGKCGVMEGAQKVFDKSTERDLVTWTTLIQGYMDMGCYEKGVQTFYQMCETGVRADEMTMVVLISACAKLRDLNLGKKLHKYMIDHELNLDVYVGNALIDMYMKCGDADLSVRVFTEMPVKNVVTWNSMILGLVQRGEFTMALNVFKKMKDNGVEYDEVTLVGVLNCCANLGAYKQGKWVHSYIDKNGVKADGFIGNALLDMYMKCGHVENAICVFKRMKHRDVVTYTSMIVGLAINGNGRKAVEIFSEMSKTGIVPNDVTYVGMLMACSHAGLVKEGCKYFVDMITVHNITPRKEHYGCMVDLLGRAGLLNEAEDFIDKMTTKPDGVVWGALLAACRTHGNIEIGKRMMKKVDEMDTEIDDGAYVLMSNLYCSSYRWRDAFKLRKTMKERNVRKSPGCSSVEVDGVVYEFRKGDKSHMKAKEIYMLLDTIEKHLKNSDQIVA
ncbi:pentatricopeptide repeat-containing protein At1g08070, chloroplastic-like [Rutidosis leptorrhynchoides]|uniref:pentatricopeptide repeat-containing protein At1g08070, chloroplastic-like n=1 Tax=Rutidosis leptorrhynchoides TaxID=125765 RepID=UPI003A99A700